MLERQLVEEVQWDAKSSRAGLLESSIHDALNHSHHLLLDEEQEMYETLYDDQTALDAINDDILTEQHRLGALQSRLQLLGEKNNLSLAKLEIQGHTQAVPHSIAKFRQEIEYHITAVTHDIAHDKDLLLDFEMKLLTLGSSHNPWHHNSTGFVRMIQSEFFGQPAGGSLNLYYASGTPS